MEDLAARRVAKRDILCLYEKRKPALPEGWKIRIINKDNIKKKQGPQNQEENSNKQVQQKENDKLLQQIENSHLKQQKEKQIAVTSILTTTATTAREFDPSFASSPSIDTQAELNLSEEQKYTLDTIIHQGKSVFFTGSAGTGKSYLLRVIIQKLLEKYEKKNIAITASTGIAASNIGGMTIHSYAGIGFGNKEGATYVKSIKNNFRLKNRWLDTKVWIIDEVSMLHGDLLDLIEYLAREIKVSSVPFGNIQIILCGDFLQLPPIAKGPSDKAKFAFQANCWKRIIQETIILKHVFRQKDQEFIDLLNQVRVGKLTSDTIQKLKSLERPPIAQSGIVASQLFSLRKQVDDWNDKEINKLKGKSKIYQANLQGPWKFENSLVPERLYLKKEAQVILIKNLASGLVNGSIGKVIGFFGEAPFDKEEEMKKVCALPEYTENQIEERYLQLSSSPIPYPVVDFGDHIVVLKVESWSYEDNEGNTVSSVKQIPLMLAWAISIHKSQGQSLDAVCVNLENIFADGQAYVALSRATSLKGLQVLNFSPKKVHANPDVLRFYNDI